MLLRHDVFHRLCRARDLLSDVREDERQPSVRDVAAEVGISPFHFIRLFEAVFGLTPHQFRTRARLERARQLLALGSHSVTDVCLEVGFSSLGSFSGLFTRHVGEPPSTYRRRTRAMIQVPGMLPPQLVPGCFSLMGLLPRSAFAVFEKRAGGASGRLVGVTPAQEGRHANQAHQHHG